MPRPSRIINTQNAMIQNHNEDMQIHHNFIRSHMVLDGKTPSDMAGIKIDGNNKWITLIQKSVIENDII